MDMTVIDAVAADIYKAERYMTPNECEAYNRLIKAIEENQGIKRAEKKNQIREWYRVAGNIYRKAEDLATKQFFKDLAEENGVIGNPKLYIIEKIAWEQCYEDDEGYDGYTEYDRVALLYNKMVELIK